MVLIILLTLAVAVCGVLYWFEWRPDAPGLIARALDSSPSSQGTPPPADSSESESSRMSSQSSEPEPEPEPEPQPWEMIVPKGPKQDESYLDDAVFVGDSLTEGMVWYLDTPLVAHTGINPDTILTKKVIQLEDGSKGTIREALQQMDPGKIYVMLGANGVGWIGKDNFIRLYGEFLDEIKLDHPDSIIYVQSILPVTTGREKQDDGAITNEKIRSYNEAIFEMTKEKEVYFVNVYEAIAGEDGALPEEDAAKDGLHLNAATYEKWIDYLLCHVVEGPSDTPASDASDLSDVTDLSDSSNPVE